MNGEEKPKVKGVQLHTEEKLQKLSEDPDNIVYHYKDTDALPPDKVLPLNEVRDHIIALDKVYQAKVEQEESKEIDHIRTRTLRDEVRASDPRWQAFSETHPMIFDRCTTPGTTQKEIKALLYMLFLKKEEQEGRLRNGQAHLQKYIMDTFSMPEAEWKKTAAGKDPSTITIDPKDLQKK